MIEKLIFLAGTMGPSLVSLSSSILICMFWLALAAEMEIDPVWENVFKARSDDDWRTVWHTERHRRCYHDLLVHMDWGVAEKRNAAHHALVKRASSTSAAMVVPDAPGKNTPNTVRLIRVRS
ncbi:hypothetical protein CEXT_274301 [Caerostris extrusa]|uniref:Uncharacterized protein n=1 Tax=Caerostris extrusa TaxID=172846 RepID=A0AAV4XY47_CAEEX|nr:hypothetical protein CEXT_274301 [Caerostris extrusa]